MSIKGHVEIELKDVNTGEVQHIDGGNFVTNAITDFSKILPGSNTVAGVRDLPNQLLFPVATNALGGLLIFENSLSSDVTDYQFKPSVNNKLVAMAGSDSDATHPNRGSYNGTESGATTTGFRSVWDFGTSQANGQISALARTNVSFTDYPNMYLIGGQYYLTDAYIFDLADSKIGIVFKYNETTQEMFAVNVKGTSVSGVYEAQVYKRRIPKFSYKVYEIPSTLGDIETVGEPFEIDLRSYSLEHGVDSICSYRLDCSVDEDAGYLYVPFGPYAQNTTFKILRVNLSTLAMDLLTVTNGFSFKYTNMTVSGGYIFAKERNSTNLHIMNLSDLTDDTVITLQNVGDEVGISVGSGAVLCGISVNSSDYTNLYIVYSDGTKTKVGKEVTSGTDATVDNARKLPFTKLMRTSYATGYTNPRLIPYITYLGTKYNLPTPVTKTAAQTMKIIYTLTDSGN